MKTRNISPAVMKTLQQFSKPVVGCSAILVVGRRRYVVSKCSDGRYQVNRAISTSLLFRCGGAIKDFFARGFSQTTRASTYAAHFNSTPEENDAPLESRDCTPPPVESATKSAEQAHQRGEADFLPIIKKVLYISDADKKQKAVAELNLSPQELVTYFQCASQYAVKYALALPLRPEYELIDRHNRYNGVDIRDHLKGVLSCFPIGDIFSLYESLAPLIDLSEPHDPSGTNYPFLLLCEHIVSESQLRGEKSDHALLDHARSAAVTIKEMKCLRKKCLDEKILTSANCPSLDFLSEFSVKDLYAYLCACVNGRTLKQLQEYGSRYKQVALSILIRMDKDKLEDHSNFKNAQEIYNLF